MDNENKKNQKTNLSEANKSKSPPGGYKPNWFYLLVVFLLLFFVFFGSIFDTKEISWLEFEQTMLSQHDVAKIIVVNKEIAEIYIKKERLEEVRHKEFSESIFRSEIGPHYAIHIGSVESFENKLEQAQQNFSPEEKFEIRYVNRTSWITILSWIFPIGLLFLFWILMFRGIGKVGRGGMGGTIFNFGKSTAKLMNKDTKSTTTFNDIAGLKEAKIEVKEIIDFLNNPETYTKLGAKIPKGVMLVGPPGTGKTLMARAVAGEAKVPFFSLSGSEFVEMFVGVGASRVRDLFKQAKEKAPSIIFIDEIDAIGRSRGKANAFQTNDERENTLNQLLTELDGFGTNTGVIVLAGKSVV